MSREYERIQRRAKEDPGTAGDQGEENWATLLRGWIPEGYHVVTKGRILGHSGVASPQVDVVILRPSYPPHLRDKKLYLAAGVAAAFECKLTLKREHLADASRTAVLIRNLLPERTGTPYRELVSPLIYGVLAHSHSWKAPASKPVETIADALASGLTQSMSHPREMVDLVCVADLATWVTMKVTWFGPTMFADWATMAPMYGPGGSATSSYVCHAKDGENQKLDFTPIGTLIPHLLHKLAWEDPSLRGVAEYFFQSKATGSGKGAQHLWSSDIYSPATSARVVSGDLTNGDRWGEWGVSFF